MQTTFLYSINVEHFQEVFLHITRNLGSALSCLGFFFSIPVWWSILTKFWRGVSHGANVFYNSTASPSLFSYQFLLIFFENSPLCPPVYICWICQEFFSSLETVWTGTQMYSLHGKITWVLEGHYSILYPDIVKLILLPFLKESFV